MSKIKKKLCLKWTYRLFGNDFRVASLFTRYFTTKGVIPESFKTIDQF